MRIFIASFGALLTINIYGVGSEPHERILANTCEVADNTHEELQEQAEALQELDMYLTVQFEALLKEKAGEEKGAEIFDEFLPGLINFQQLQNTLQPLLVQNKVKEIKAFCEEHEDDSQEFWMTIQSVWGSLRFENEEYAQNEAFEELGKALDDSGVGRFWLGQW